MKPVTTEPTVKKTRRRFRLRGALFAVLIPLLLAALAACSASGGDSDEPDAGNTQVAVTGVSVSPASVTLNTGTTLQLSAAVAPANATVQSVGWASGSAAVATVGANGLVTAVSAGSATITVTTTDGGKTAACAVTVREPDVYIGGSYNDGSIAHPGYWKNGVWTALDPGTPGQNAEVYTILVHEGDIYAGGYSNDGTRDVPGYWKNGVWTALPAAFSDTSGHVRSISVAGSDIHAAGPLYNSGVGDWDLTGHWKNGSLTSYQILGSSGSSYVKLIISGSDVYITGNDNSGSPQTGGYWKNGTWTTLTAFAAGQNYTVNSLAVSGGQVKAAGSAYYGSPYGTPRAVQWAAGAASALDSSAIFESQAFDMTYSGEDLYIAGWHNAESDSPDFSTVPCYWKNGELVLLPKPDVDGLRSGTLQTEAWMAVSGSLVFVAAAVRDDNLSGSVPYVWRAGVRTQLETQPGNLYHHVYGVALY